MSQIAGARNTEMAIRRIFSIIRALAAMAWDAPVTTRTAIGKVQTRVLNLLRRGGSGDSSRPVADCATHASRLARPIFPDHKRHQLTPHLFALYMAFIELAFQQFNLAAHTIHGRVQQAQRIFGGLDSIILQTQEQRDSCCHQCTQHAYMMTFQRLYDCFHSFLQTRSFALNQHDDGVWSAYTIVTGRDSRRRALDMGVMKLTASITNVTIVMHSHWFLSAQLAPDV